MSLFLCDERISHRLLSTPGVYLFFSLASIKVAYDSSVVRSLGTSIRGHTPTRVTDKPRHPGEKQTDSSPERRGQSSLPETQDRGCRLRCDFYWSSPLFRFRRPLSSLVFITSVTNDSMSVQNRSDWSMRGTMVSGVSSEPIAWPRTSLATPHFAQTKSACSALSTGESQ